MFRIILALALLCLASHTIAQSLEVIVSNTRLPIPIECMPVVYDGEDSIYVLGGAGDNGYYQTDILKFSVTAETIEMFGLMDPVVFGSAVWAGDDKILYFGGYDNLISEAFSKVWKYAPDGEREWTQVGDLPRAFYSTSSVWGHSEYSYVFGGYDYSVGNLLNTISRYSSVTNTSIDVGELPSPREGTSAVWDEATNNAYVFGGRGNRTILNDILKFNPVEGAVLLNVTLPGDSSDSCAIWTGEEAYIIVGYPLSKIARFNPSTNEILDVPVNNLPSLLTGHGCAFVQKLNRIYIFGGNNNVRTRDEIMYIDLGPSPTQPTSTSTPPTTTTKKPCTPIDCNNEVDGTRFLNPYCCESYYQCQNQVAERRQCPSQLHFNPSVGECDLKEIVKCRSVYE